MIPNPHTLQVIPTIIQFGTVFKWQLKVCNYTIATISAWLKNLTPVFQPMRSRTKTNCTLYVRFFLMNFRQNCSYDQCALKLTALVHFSNAFDESQIKSREQSWPHSPARRKQKLLWYTCTWNKKYWCSLQAPQTRLSKNYSRYWAVGSLWELDYCSHEKGNFNFNEIINLQCNALVNWKCQEWTQAEQYTVPCCFSNIREKDWLSTSVYGNLTKFFVCCPHRTSTTLAIHTTDNKTKKNKTSYNI